MTRRYRNKTLQVRVTPSEHQLLLREAQRQGLGISELVRKFIENLSNPHLASYLLKPLEQDSSQDL
jgi:predicted HicB family RNase H-like nuclease